MTTTAAAELVDAFEEVLCVGPLTLLLSLPLVVFVEGEPEPVPVFPGVVAAPEVPVIRELEPVAEAAAPVLDANAPAVMVTGMKA